MKSPDSRRSFSGDCAVSSVVEHFLDTEGAGNRQVLQLQSPSKRVTIVSNFCSDLVPKKQGRGRLLVRIGTGLYRYGPTGIIYWCRKINHKNVWRNLQTNDKARAMAIVALNIYTAGQNGNMEVKVLPDGKPPCPEFRPPEWLAGTPTETPPATSFIPPAPPSLEATVPTVRSEQRTGKSLNVLVERFKNEAGHLAASTREKFNCHFKVAAEYLNFERDVSAITLADLRQLKSELANGRKPATVNDILFKALAALFRMAVDDEIIEKSPLEKLKRAKRSEPDRQQPTWEQAQLIEDEVRRYAPETALIVGFMRQFGVGQAEIKHLVGEHVDCERNVIHFRRKKTGKPFDVPIFQHARPFVEKLKKDGRLEIGKSVVQWRNPRKALGTACDRLALPSYEPRALRRSFIVHCLQQGIDPRLVAKWQGHRDAKLIFSVYGKYIDCAYEQAQAEKLGGATETAIEQRQ